MVTIILLHLGIESFKAHRVALAVACPPARRAYLEGK
jgi:hypothetical protein